MNYLYIKPFIHYFLHFIFPIFIALFFYKNRWKKAYLLLLSTMIIDLDHLLATPIFSANRNSLEHHLLHSFPMIIFYFLGCVFFKGNYRIISIGLLFHIITDAQDYYFWRWLSTSNFHF